MKKQHFKVMSLAFVLAAVSLTACNNEEKKEETPAPAATEAPAADTLKTDSLPKVDTAATPRTDPIKTLH